MVYIEDESLGLGSVDVGDVGSVKDVGLGVTVAVDKGVSLLQPSSSQALSHHRVNMRSCLYISVGHLGTQPSWRGKVARGWQPANLHPACPPQSLIFKGELALVLLDVAEETLRHQLAKSEPEIKIRHGLIERSEVREC